ncbi:MAG: gamma-glutamyltransferase [Dehalococcoidia bacterium]
MNEHLRTKATYTKTEAISNNGMVATKDKLSTEAGLEILKLGGNAVDAGIAACLAVGVVEPESSGIGGGGYMTFQVGEQGGVIGFPMKGPLNGSPEMYELTGESSVGSFGWAGVKNDENIHGYKSIAVPGCIAGLLEAHKRFGKIPLSEVVAPAVKLAKDGFYPEWFTLYKFASLTEMLLRYEELGKTFMPSGILPFGGINGPYTLKQDDLANTLEAIGKNGLDGFYRSEITENIVNDIQNNGGILTMEDFDQYKPFFWIKD